MDMKFNIRKRATGIALPVVVALLAGPLVSIAFAKVKPSALFGSHMVLQRDAGIPVFGAADPGEEVTVTLAGRTASTRADVQGRWRVEFPAMPAGGPHEITISGADPGRLADILIGDVWVCSGQSNMKYPVWESLDAQESYKIADLPNVRLMIVNARAESEPQREPADAAWKLCNRENVGGFSAVGFHFGRKLHERLNIPIGLIQSALGSSRAEAWSSRESLLSAPETKAILDYFEVLTAQYIQQRREYAVRFIAWWKDVESALQAGDPIPEKPSSPGTSRIGDPRITYDRPACLFNGGIAPLTQMPIKGVIWYQGESNAGLSDQYRTLLPALIKGWRDKWEQPDLPFLILQLPGMPGPWAKPDDTTLAEMREAQLMTWQNVPHAGLAITLDCGADPNDPKQDWLHPPNKRPMGERLALVARAVVYGEAIEYSGPIYQSMIVEGAAARLIFTHAGSGLVSKGDTLEGFAMAGPDRKFLPAQARIDGQTIVVTSAQVADPLAVRYCFNTWPVPMGNLYNKEGLPASPFRTDDWPCMTTGLELR